MPLMVEAVLLSSQLMARKSCLVYGPRSQDNNDVVVGKTEICTPNLCASHFERMFRSTYPESFFELCYFYDTMRRIIDATSSNTKQNMPIIVVPTRTSLRKGQPFHANSLGQHLLPTRRHPFSGKIIHSQAWLLEKIELNDNEGRPFRSLMSCRKAPTEVWLMTHGVQSLHR